nr:Ada metal-binding domain-containing protein [Aggregatibacter actinomycetemcomitans]
MPSKATLRKNIKYFNTREEAIEKGFRPCLRCKPEYAPKYNEISKQAIIVNQIISKIQAGELLTSSITKIVAKVLPHHVI